MKSRKEKQKILFILIYIQKGETKQEKGDFPAMNLIKKVLCYTDEGKTHRKLHGVSNWEGKKRKKLCTDCKVQGWKKQIF